jgi:hypothetical protein
MIRTNMTREDVVRMCSPFDQAAHVGVHPAPDAKIVLHNTRPLGVKHQRIVLLPGLHGKITSDDGLEITVQYRDAKAWLASH